MRAEFRAPQRRTRVYEDYEAPLPVSRDQHERKVYRAELINQQVLVCHPDHIQKIHNQGFFGKGVLSRARPNHSVSDKWEKHAGLRLPVVSPSRYEELLRWAKEALSAEGLDEELFSETLLTLTRAVDIEDVKKELGGGQAEGENGTREEEEEVKPVGEACDLSKRQRLESEAKRGCRSNQQDPDSSSEQDSDSSPDSGPDPASDSELDNGLMVPGPGFVLVVSEGQDGGGVREVRRSPLSFTEYLQLGLEEAFFLVYSLGCLSVYLQQEPLSIIHLWRKFRSLHPDFISLYAAYHHFRSKGWVPKGGGGAKYGADLMLYRKGPPFYHASYSVVVERTDETFRGMALRPFSWRSLAALSRITANVSKELMLCYVIYPTDLLEAELDSPACLSRLKVQEVIVSRWVSSRERAEQDNI